MDKRFSCPKQHGVLILDNSMYMGGLEKKLLEFVSSLDRKHFRVVVCCLKEGGYLKSAFDKMDVPFYERLLLHKFDFTAYFKLSRIIEDEGIDMIYSFLHPNTVIFSSLAKASAKIRAWVISVHATGAVEGGKLVRGYLKPFLGRVDRFIAVAEKHKEHLVREEGLPEDKVEVIYNGVNLKNYHPGKKREELLEELGLGDAEAVVSTVASLKPLKCIDVLIRSAALVTERRKGVRFLIVGDGPERSRLERMAGDLGLRDKVIFAGLREDVADILRLSAVFVLPSSTEAFPNAIIEAMATGLPVVATDVGSVEELVTNEVEGYLFKPGDEKALADAIIDLLADGRLAASFGEAGRTKVGEKFTLEKMSEAREELFSRLLCRQAG